MKTSTFACCIASIAALALLPNDIEALVMSQSEFGALRSLGIRSIDERLAEAAAEHRAAVGRASESAGTPPSAAPSPEPARV